MDKYFVLMTVTDAGALALDTAADSLDAVRERVENEGHIGSATIYLLMGGPFDLIAECEASSVEGAAYFAVELAKTGLVRTMTQKAITVGKFDTEIRQRLGKMAP